MRERVPLAPYTTWGVGGPAELLAEPDTLEEVLAACEYARAAGLPLTILGRGSNVLVADEGVPGLVVCLRSGLGRAEVDLDRGIVAAEAGCSLPRLALAAASAGLTGFEFLVGIPGTVGGGVAMNAGTGGPGGPCVGDLLVDVDLLDPRTGRVHTVPARDLTMEYRRSSIHRDGVWVVGARLRATGAEAPERIVARHAQILEQRRTKAPTEPRTAGSVFRQPDGGQPAGWYIDRAGLKGRRVGGACVSPKHANWIINDGTACAADIRALMALVQCEVEEQFGIRLEPEVVMVPGAHPAESGPGTRGGVAWA